jgi:hypothetical protein
MTHPASAQTREQLIAGAKKEGTLILTVRRQKEAEVNATFRELFQ